MIYLLYGPDTYRSRAKLREIIAAFSAKAGGALNVTRVDAEERPEAVLAVGRAATLFSPKELVVIERASRADGRVSSFLRERLGSWSRDRNLTVVFWEGGAAAPALAEIAGHATKSQEFAPLGSRALERWIAVEASARGLRIAPEERRILATRYGSDLWAIANELEKVHAGWSLRREASQAEKVWDFTDAFLGRPRRAFRPLTALLGAGYEPLYLLGALAGALRNLALVWEASRQRAGAPPGLHPFVAKKYAELARRMDAAALRERFRALLAADVTLKTGKLPPPLPLIKLVIQHRPPA